MKLTQQSPIHLRVKEDHTHADYSSDYRVQLKLRQASGLSKRHTMTLQPTAAPTTAAERYDVLDALRGFALFGIFLANIRFFSGWGFLDAEQRTGLAGDGYGLFWAFGVDKSLGLYDLAYAIMPPGAEDPMVDLGFTDWGERLQSSFGLGVLRFGSLFDTWRWPKLFTIMLLGLWAGRRLVRGELLSNTKLLVVVLLAGGLSGAVAGPILASLDGLGFDRPHSLDGFFAVIAYTFAVIPLGLAYAAGFVLLWRIASGILRVFAAPGRMALTNYLSQTLIALTVFYGIGLNQAGEWSIQAILAFACAVYAVQVVLSNLWLRSFKYGPMEWLWRALTYGTAPKIRRSAA